MKIKDLPQPIKELALKRQVEQGNEPNENLDLTLRAEECNFDWYKTIEDYDFWDEIDNANFKPFYDLYPQDVDTSKDEFAIGFTEWLGLNNYKFSLKYKSYQKKHINETMFYDTKQLLEIYKKEQGL